jgi:hypothetical protein
MPPPVPPVLAPINISVINNKRPVSEIEFKEIGKFVKPAVLALSEANQKTKTRPRKKKRTKKNLKN